MRVATARTIYLLIPVVLSGLAILHVAQNHRASLVLSHYINGRVGNCTLSESFEGEALFRLQVANFDAIRSSSRVIRRDGPYSLWSTPDGEYWMPTASGDKLLYDVAEQKRDIYGTRLRPGDIVLDARRKYWRLHSESAISRCSQGDRN
jgi:hypothetical protein